MSKKMINIKNIEELCDFMKRQETNFFVGKWPGSGERTSLVCEENFRTVYERIQKEEKIDKKLFFMVVKNCELKDKVPTMDLELESCQYKVDINNIEPLSFEVFEPVTEIKSIEA